MKHYAVEDWVLLAAGRIHPQLEREMREHVAAGCVPCAQHMERWLHQAPGTPAANPGKGDTHPSLADFHLAEPPLPVQMLYDSARFAPPAGRRSAEEDSRHLLYKAGSFIVDIHLEVEPGTTRVSLAGQVLHHPDPLGGVSDLPVFLVEGGGKAVAETRTNDVGEFLLDLDARERLRLALVINDRRAVVIPTNDLRVAPDELDARELTKTEPPPSSGPYL